MQQMAGRSTNTMVEGLQRMLADLSQMKVAVDADLPFIVQVETMIVDKLRDPVSQMQNAGLLPPGQQGQQGGPAGPPPGMGGPPPGPPSGPSFAGAGMPGLQQGPAAPNADELGRLLRQ